MKTVSLNVAPRAPTPHETRDALSATVVSFAKGLSLACFSLGLGVGLSLKPQTVGQALPWIILTSVSFVTGGVLFLNSCVKKRETDAYLARLESDQAASLDFPPPREGLYTAKGRPHALEESTISLHI